MKGSDTTTRAGQTAANTQLESNVSTDAKGLSIHDTAVQTGVIAGVAVALVLVAIAFSVRRVMNGEAYSPLAKIQGLTERLGGGGSADPFGDEWDMNMSMNMSDMSGNSNSPDWTATMDINPGAFQRGQVDNSELAELATTNL